jgi:hypothetical protein
VRTRWTSEKVKRLLGKKKLLLRPDLHFHLLFEMGLMNSDATISPDQVKKFLQINHMVTLFWPKLQELQKMMPGAQIRLIDVGCGNSYLGLALAQLWKETHPEVHTAAPASLKIYGVDLNEKVLITSRARAARLQLNQAFEFFKGSLASISELSPHSENTELQLPERLHGVLALHACDKATDEALAFGLHAKANWIAVVPCCQAELAKIFAAQNNETPLGVIIRSPQLRRESAATLTDGLRMALVRAMGYEVTATEFVPSTHTPKNRLLNCERRGNYSTEAWKEYCALKELLQIDGLELENRVSDHIKALFPQAHAE